MSGYNYGNNNPQGPPHNPIYPQIYGSLNAPPPGQPMVQPMPGFPTQTAQYLQQPGFAVYPNQQPSVLSYPTGYQMMPPAYGSPSAPPVITPQQNFEAAIEWIPTSPRDAARLSNKAVVAGYEGHDHSPLWVIRARHEGDLIPGKLAIKHAVAYIPWGGQEVCVQNIEVCCARPDKIRWVETRDGNMALNAIIGGTTASGEPLYIGRAREQGSLTPGKVHPSHRAMYISFGGREIAHKTYEILCTVNN